MIGCVASQSDGGHFCPDRFTAPQADGPYWLDEDNILACVPLEPSGGEEDLITSISPFCDPMADTAHWGISRDVWAPLHMGAGFPNPFMIIQQPMGAGCAPTDFNTAAGCWVSGVDDICSNLSVSSQAESSPCGLWMQGSTVPIPDLPDFSPDGHIAEMLRPHSEDLDCFSSSMPCSPPQQPSSMHGTSTVDAARSSSIYSDQELLWAPEMPKPAYTRQPRKKRSAPRVACSSSVQAACRFGGKAPQGRVERSKEIQRNYLKRKRVRVGALHAHLDKLRERKALLVECVAPLVSKYVALTSSFSLHKMQEEAQFLASIGTAVPDVLAAVHNACSSPDAPPALLFSLLSEAAEVGDFDIEPDAAGVSRADPHAIRSLVAKLRVTKKQRDVLVEQTREALKQVAELRAKRSRLALQLQALAQRGVNASMVSWLGASGAAHLIVGQLRGLASRERDLLAGVLLACLAAVRNDHRGLLSDAVMAKGIDVYTLCLEMIDIPRSPGAGHV